LSEGVAEYLARRFRADVEGPAAARRAWSEVRARAMAAEASHPHPLRPRDPEGDVLRIFDGVVYDKGAFVLHLLAHEIGEDRTPFDLNMFGTREVRYTQGGPEAQAERREKVETRKETSPTSSG